MLLTDGLFEGHSGPGNERLGEDGLLELARSRARRCPAPAFVDALIDEAEQRAQAHGGLTDDIAVVRVNGPVSEDGRLTGRTAGLSPDRRRLTVQGWQNLVLSADGYGGARRRDRRRRCC